MTQSFSHFFSVTVDTYTKQHKEEPKVGHCLEKRGCCLLCDSFEQTCQVFSTSLGNIRCGGVLRLTSTFHTKYST